MNKQPEPSSPETPPQESQDAWAIRIARVFGIPIRLHFTFLLLVIWFALSNIGMNRGWMVLSLLGLFFCIVLHELGHSIVAQRLGYPVHDITLYPIGGVAVIEGSPRPRHELLIALAGPAVNVVIAALLFAGLQIAHSWPSFDPSVPDARMDSLLNNPLTFLFVSNVFVVLFNMIPAFPMDGGRVLRAVLGLSLGKARATRIAANVGQVLAVGMAIYGLGFLNNRLNLGLVIIALFVFFGAGQERNVEQTRVTVGDAPVSAAMVRQFQTLSVGDTLERASAVLLETSQQDFPVVVGTGGDVSGVLSRSQLLRGLAQHGPSAYVAGEMTREVLFAAPDDPLEEFMMRPDGVQRAPVLVQDANQRLVGMLTLDNLMEYLTVQQIRHEREAEVGDA